LPPGAGVDATTLTNHYNADTFFIREFLGCIHVGTPAILLKLLCTGQAPGLKNQRSGIVVMIDNLSIRRFAIIIITQPTTNTNGTGSNLILTEIPTGHIHLVNPLVPHVTITVVIEPVPIVVEPLAP